MEPPRDDLPAASGEEPGEELPLIELDTLLTRPPSRRKRLWQVALVVVMLAVALAALRSILLPSPAPSDNAASPRVTATLLSNVNFGTLTVNGEKLNKPTPLTIHVPVKGVTVITLNAPPFRPYTCRFSDLTAPLDDPDHCQLTYDDTPTPTTSGALPGRFIVGIFLLPDDLPAAQQNQALAAMSQPLSTPQQTTAHPGEYIATSYRYEAQITSQRATVPLVARASFEPSQIPGPLLAARCGFTGICPRWTGPEPSTTATKHTWGLTFTEALHWQFSDTAGTIQADVSIPTVNIISVLLADDVTGWQVANINIVFGDRFDPVCQAGIAMLDFRLSGDVTIPREKGVEGCELHAQVNGVDEGRYIWRFGVLLAADALAHANQPGLPVAPAAEIAAVGG